MLIGGDRLRILYENKVSKFFDNNFQELQRAIGLEMAKAVKKRINQLKAAENFGAYLKTGLGNPHSLNGNFSNCYGVSVSANHRLVIEVALNTDCDCITVKGVADYHGEKTNWIIP